MKNFLSSIGLNKEYKNTEKITKGLFLGQRKDEGYWQIVLSNSGEPIFTSDSKNICDQIKNEIADLLHWKMIKNLDELYEEYPEIYEALIKINQKCGCSVEYNGLYLNTLNNGKVEYRYQSTVGEQKTFGFHVVNGLAYHAKTLKAQVVHVPTGWVLTNCNNEEDAKKLTSSIKGLLDWSQKDVPQNIEKSEKVRNYLSQVKYAIENGNAIPEINEELATEIMYLSNPKLKERKGVYDEAIKELHGMYGMEEIKERISQMMKQISTEQQLKNAGIRSSKRTLHTIFYGPAGTGKTQVARIMGKLLYSMGYLESYNLVETSANQMIDNKVGGTRVLTEQKIEEAMGGVLFIDEAYSFASSSLQGNKGNFGEEAITAILTAAENNRDNLCIILAGYENEMKQMMKMNEGMESRFPVNNRFNFRDYTPKQLTFILRDMLKKDNYNVDEEMLEFLEKTVEKMSKNGGMNGNARAIRNFKESIILNHMNFIEEQKIKDEEKIKNIDKNTILYSAGLVKKNKNVEGLEEVKNQALEKINKMVGMKELKASLEELMGFLLAQQRKAKAGLTTTRPNMHMIFSGPPGTGKTTVAEYVGQFLKGAGLLSNGHFLQVSGTDLTKGDPAEEVEKIVSKAVGGILFIDEAYTLCNDSRGKRAADLLIQEMENKRDDLVVILAGYEKEMQEMLELNPGFESRIVDIFDFPYYNEEEILEMLQIQLKNKNLDLNASAFEALVQGISEIFSEKGKIEGNGRWARNLSEKIEIKQGSRISKDNSDNLTEVTQSDVIKAFISM